MKLLLKYMGKKMNSDMKFLWIEVLVDLIFCRMVGKVFFNFEVLRLVRILLSVWVELSLLFVLVLDLSVCIRLGIRFGSVFLFSFLISELRVWEVVVWVVGIGLIIVSLRLVMSIGR